MKKKILSLALIAMSLVAVNSVAQTNNTGTPNQENVQCQAPGKKGECAPACPFEGLNLTDAQKTKIKELNTKRDATRTEKKKELKAEKQRKDATKMSERKNAKKTYLAEVKAILTPEQYVSFLENFYINGGNHHDKALKQGKHKDKNGKFAHKGKDDKRSHAHRGSKNMKSTNTPATNS